MGNTSVLGASREQALRERSTPEIWLNLGSYRVRLAQTDEDRAAIYRLRFRVFNLELGEGLAKSFQDGRDHDEFDLVCDHLLVEHVGLGQVVGTYRLQSGTRAGENLGYYSGLVFDFAPYEGLRSSILEVGRACVSREHRSMEVLTLLWRGIARYCQQRSLRYLVGCSSLNSQDVREGAAMYRQLQGFLVSPELRTVPLPTHVIPLSEITTVPLTPKLLRAYLAVGAKICGPPGIDREFGTIDFLTWLDLEQLSPPVRARFLS